MALVRPHPCLRMPAAIALALLIPLLLPCACTRRKPAPPTACAGRREAGE